LHGNEWRGDIARAFTALDHVAGKAIALAAGKGYFFTGLLGALGMRQVAGTGCQGQAADKKRGSGGRTDQLSFGYYHYLLLKTDRFGCSWLRVA
jgi:hypothetical protein